MKPYRVVITIDEIVLDAINNSGRAATAAALERELVRIFSEQPVSPRQGRNITRLSVPAMTIAPNAAPGALATGLAERIHGGVTAAGQPPGRSA